jgi:sporulation protein YlmC with PRC-barrel domain
MRLSELLGREVLDRDERHIGTVADVRLVQDARLVGGHDAAFRLSGLIVVERHHVRLFGYERDVGPWLVRKVVDRFCGGIVFIAWDDIEDIAAETIRTRRTANECRPLASLAASRSTGDQ